MADEPETAAAAAPEGEEGEEEQKDQTKKYDLDQTTLDNINETFEIFDKNKEDKIPSESLGSVLRWLGFNPTERELQKYTKEHDRGGVGMFKRESIY